MAIINLDVEKILSISNELNSLDTSLLNSYVPELKDIINQIKSNVLNDQVNSILGTISSQVDSISGELAIDLPKLEQFLETQMRSYQTTEADAQAKLQAVVNMMGGFAGMQPTSIDNGSTSLTSNGSTIISGGNTSNGKENDNSIYGAMATGALGGAAFGAFGGIGAAAIGATIGALAPVAVDLVGKAAVGIGTVLSSVGSWAESFYQW